MSGGKGDGEALQWAELEKLPTFDRLRTSVLKVEGENGTERTEKVDVTKLSAEDRQRIIERILRVTDDDNERFLIKLRKRLDRVGLDLPKIEVRYDNVSVEAEVHVGSRAVPSLPNFFKSIIEWPWRLLGCTGKVKVNILSNVSGILKPARLTLLLGPPESGRTTLLRALAGRLSPDLQVSGEITYNGHHMSEFVPRKTSAYVSQYDLQTAQLTVKETLNFYCRVQGIGYRYDLLEELTKREKESGIMPESDVDIYLKTTAMMGQSPNLLTDYTMKLMGLDICADTLVGDQMRRGISGGQKKRVTTAEMLVGPAKAFFLDEISTGLDSSTTFQISKMLQQIAHLMDSTIVVSLLQPAPETYAIFDDLILLAEGQIVYQGPCSAVLEFMAHMGFKCPERKAIADFLQEVTSRKDQQQYWANKSVPYRYVTVPTFVEGFKKFHVGQSLASELASPYDKSKSHPAALVYKKRTLSNLELLRACFAREFILMKRNRPTYIAKVLQIAFVACISATLYLRTTMHHNTIDEATVYMGAVFFGLVMIMMAGLPELTFTIVRLPVYYKEKELFLYPAWALSFPMFVLRIPWTILEAGVYVIIVYYVTGFSPNPGRFFFFFLALALINQATIGMFRFAAAIARVRVAADNIGSIFFNASIILGGFVLSTDNMPVWWKWAHWCSGLYYGQQAASVNEFLSSKWHKPFGSTTLGVAVLKDRGLKTHEYWKWISIAALVGWTIVFNILFTLALQYLDPAPVVRSTAMKSHEASMAVSANISRQTSARRSSGRLGSMSHRGSKRVQEIMSSARLSGSPNLDSSLRRAGSISQRRLKGLLEIASPARLSGYINLENDVLPKSMDEPSLSMHFDEEAAARWYDHDGVAEGSRGMVLPFKPLSISFENIDYYVDMPDTMKEQGRTDQKLQLLTNVSGAFRPGVLTALVGVSGAGKTTLMDVLAGRKTRGYTEGEIFISGYPKQQSTFTRIAGYCEQNDIHSPNVTVFESLVFSAWLRLSPEVDKQTRMLFVEEVMSLVELDMLRDFIVGIPGQSGLSTEQRKRLTIAVELVANPSIIFMDEPTSGLDARAAAIVMRAVRNIGDTGRTIVCTIHQPNIDIFEAFDELLLLSRGGKTIYGGPLGRQSKHLVDYFEAIPGIQKLNDGYNPAAWMLEVSSISMESSLGVNFAEIYANSPAYQKNASIIKQLSSPALGSKDLEFPTVYAQFFWVQCLACIWKMAMSYWRNTMYSGVKILYVTFMGLFFGSIFWGLGKKRDTQQDVFNLMGVYFTSVLFVGFGYTMAIQPIIAIERFVYYRERGAGMYSPLTYALAQFFIELPYVFCHSIIFTFIIYAMIQFEWQSGKVLWFFFFVYLSLLFYVYWGMIAVAATPNPQAAAILATFPFALLSLFSGFPITRKQMPVWWRWFYWCVPTAWTLYGFAGSQLGDDDTKIAVLDLPDQKITVKEFISSYYGFEYSFLKYVAIEQVALVLTLAFLFTVCIKYCNFQRR